MRRPRLTIAGPMGSVPIAAPGMAALRAPLMGDPEVRPIVGFLLLMTVACPALAFGVDALARWAFTPPGGAGGPPDEA